MIEKLRAAGVEFGKVVVSRMPQVLAGKAVVVTGTLEGFSREEADAAIKDRGGKSPGSVSAKTFAVVVGAEPGASKVTKADRARRAAARRGRVPAPARHRRAAAGLILGRAGEPGEHLARSLPRTSGSTSARTGRSAAPGDPCRSARARCGSTPARTLRPAAPVPATRRPGEPPGKPPPRRPPPLRRR